jgi:predicted flap endonuclease-1-like 5' DNA nuclease
MATPSTPSSTPRFTPVELAWAFVAGGGITLIILALGLGAMRTDSSASLNLTAFTGVLLVIGGAIGWAVMTRPWEHFDDLTTPFYTGHAHHDDHAHDSHADDHAAEAEYTTGVPYMGDHPEYVQEVATFEVLDTDPAVEEAVIPPPPDMFDPMSAFPPAPSATETVETVEKTEKAAEKDDISRLHGIGPKINKALNDAGIFTFAQIATHAPEQLEKIVRDAGVRMVGKAETWVEDSKKIVSGDLSPLQSASDANLAPDV